MKPKSPTKKLGVPTKNIKTAYFYNFVYLVFLHFFYMAAGNQGDL